MSNFDFVNFSPSTKTPASGVMERRNCLMLLLLYNVMICLLEGGGCPTRELYIHWRRTCTSPLSVKGCIYWPMATELWGFLSVPHLLWYDLSVYNAWSSPKTNDIHILAVKLSLPVLMTSTTTPLIPNGSATNEYFYFYFRTEHASWNCFIILWLILMF